VISQTLIGPFSYSGGVVGNTYFKSKFGILGNTAQENAVASNVVAVLQAGAFFGALGSAPISGRSLFSFFSRSFSEQLKSQGWKEVDDGVVHYCFPCWSSGSYRVHFFDFC